MVEQFPAGSARSPTSRQNAQAMVSAAIAAQRTGDLALAEQLLLQAVEFQPDSADALQLLGLIAKGRGELQQAEALMRKSLAADKKQPHVHYNLANLLRRRMEREEALRHYDHAIELNPDYAEALTQRGETLLLLQRFTEAEPSLRKAYRLQPQSVAAVVGLADVCGKLGKMAEAERLLRDGLSRQPDNPFYRNNLGELLTRQQRYQDALDILQPLLGARPTAEILVNFANALVGAGRLDEALRHYANAIDADPLNYFAHTNLNDLLWQLGRPEDVGKSYIAAKQALPDHPDILELSAECMLTFARVEEAEADLARAASLRPRSMAQYRLWTALRLAQRRPAEAMSIAGEGLKAAPKEIDLLGKYAEAAFQLDLPQEALKAGRRMSEIDPINQYAACYEAVGLRMLGDHEGAKRLYDYERFVHAASLPPPAEYGSLAAFHAVLAARLEELHHAKHEPILQTLRNGTQTHESLFTRPGIDRSIALLGEAILAAAGFFMDSLPADPSHPFLGRKGGGMAWSGSWSVRLRDGGFHVDHIHPKGWISGAYYVETPDCVADEALKPGWIKFGEFQRDTGQHLPWEKAIRPRPGLLVLFPSYMTHGTLPISGVAQRLTVSFDIVPAVA